MVPPHKAINLYLKDKANKENYLQQHQVQHKEVNLCNKVKIKEQLHRIQLSRKYLLHNNREILKDHRRVLKLLDQLRESQILNKALLHNRDLLYNQQIPHCKDHNNNNKGLSPLLKNNNYQLNKDLWVAPKCRPNNLSKQDRDLNKILNKNLSLNLLKMEQNHNKN